MTSKKRPLKIILLKFDSTNGLMKMFIHVSSDRRVLVFEVDVTEGSALWFADELGVAFTVVLGCRKNDRGSSFHVYHPYMENEMIFHPIINIMPIA
jgi:hypothetical protein